jgi:hypothetical protein
MWVCIPSGRPWLKRALGLVSGTEAMTLVGAGSP